MERVKQIGVFPYDRDTIWIISKIEVLLGLKSRDTDRMSYSELIEYIDMLSIELLNKNVN